MPELRPFEEQEKKWLTEYYSSAIGLTITGFKWHETEDIGEPGKPEIIDFEWYEQMPVLICRAPNGETVELEVSQDQEGNGSGFLFGLVAPPPVQ